jgi:hypothetical protein
MEEMEKLVVEIELTKDELSKLAAYVEAKCLDQRRYLKKLLEDRVYAVLKKQDRAAARAKRTESDKPGESA